MDVQRMAAELGTERGIAAASWVFDGNTTDETYRQFLQMWEDGDPLIDGFGPASGWLSGEYAEGPTPTELAHDLGLETDPDSSDYDEYAIDEACNAYEAAADESYWSHLETVARRMTE